MILRDTAHAKLNLALHVRRKRADGYHDLETVFAFTELGDDLSAEPAEGLSLEIDGPFAEGLSAGEDNLILRAARALWSAQKSPFVLSLSKDVVAPASEHATWFDKLTTNGGGEGLPASGSGERPGAKLRLSKNLPVASGIGGGSADAAATLRLLNRLWNLGHSLDGLARIGATLGADVAACVHSRTLRGEGRGDALVPYDTPYAGAPVLLVNPRVAVSTAPVFRAWDGVDCGTLGALAASRNDLQAPAIGVAPVIADVLAALSALPSADFVRMSGSGATCFAIFSNASSRDSAAAALANHDWWVAATSLLQR